MNINEKQNLSIESYESIKRMILNGELKQGQAISISAMAESLQISRTPVTNACQRLEHEKFLTILPKQGAIVNTISIEAACGIYELRAAIESYNAKRVINLITAEDIRILKDSIQIQYSAIERKDSVAFMEADIFFHKYILEKNKNYEVTAVINPLYDRAFMLGIKNSMSDARIKSSLDEHTRIIEALEKRDIKEFADAIEANILNGLYSLTGRYFIK
ncbi:GntR family transcriptional regulator [Chakrabartyella piscis]|uniref:GntR family transcriptional regulator n=1 Tax=Chakrabartyella piscis TaxID=2918914 RepID=UPI002958BDC4|nr:GntR family transcriptional regulator [Chakrabartyella piscis]